jgi:hypothetical protein
MSRIPGPTCHDPFCCRLPSRTPGVLGQNDAGYRHENALPGDTPGPLGVNDHSAALASKGKVEVYRYRPPIFASYSSGNNLEKLKEFVGVATRWGLPTKMLSRVLEKCSVGIAPDDGEEEYQRFKMWGIAVGRKFNLHAETMDGIQVLHPGQDGSSQAHQIASIYHESTHAFFDIEGDDETVKPVMAHGETYFTGAPLSAGGVTKDPNRTFQEVAAEYVENRVWGWWTSLEKIKFNMQRGTLDKQLEKIRTFYNGEMSKSLLGEAHWKQNGEDVLNARPISKELKAFLDHTILEDRIPDRFDSVQLFTNLIKSVEPNQIVLSGDVLFDFDKSELRPIAIYQFAESRCHNPISSTLLVHHRGSH